jgi:hypothetical protein
MEIDAALVLGIGVLEIVGEAADAREFHARRGVQVGVAAAEIDRTVTDADIGEPICIVITDGNVACGVNHVIVDTVVPLQRECWIEIAIGDERVFQKARALDHNRPRGRRQRAGDACGISAVDAPATDADSCPPSTGVANV